MLQKTGWRIKQLVSSKGNRASDSIEGESQDFRGPDRQSADNAAQRQSWSSQGQSQERSLALRRTSSNVLRPRPLPPADISAHSSASSLCSCNCGVHVDCEADVAGNLHSLSKAGPGQPNPDILYLPPLKSATSLGSDAKTWRQIFSGSPPKSPAYSSQRYIFESQKAAANTVPTGETFDLLQALTIEPAEDEPTPTPSVKGMADRAPEIVAERVADNVEQLIRETDAAFQAVGTALADAKVATQDWYDIGSASNTARATTITRKASKRQYHRPASPLKNHSTKATTFAGSKRKKSTRKKTGILTRRNRAVPAPVAPPTTRHTLNDMTLNMAEVFNKRFRTEVDEMLTPDRIQQMRAESKVSSDSSRSSASEGTQDEPFHLEAVASRLDAARAILTPSPDPIFPPPIPPVPDKSSLRQLNQFKNKKKEREAEIEELATMFAETTFQSSPRHRSIPRKPTSLETIPEASTLRLIPDGVLLPSTNYTLTAPRYRHGPIRLSHPHQKRKASFADDENLDWTAFQMAIAGGIDEDNERRLERDRIAEQQLVDDICDWWDGFGFESPGQLVTEADEERRSKKRKQTRKQKKIAYDWYERETKHHRHGPVYEVDASYEIAAQQRSSSSSITREKKYWPRGMGIEAGASTSTTTTGKAKKRAPELNLKLRSWRGHEAMGNSSGGGPDSLPPSPMLDLVVPSPSRRDEDLVPMGYNLGHDLGDFLRWESQHRQSVFADDLK
ncbi:hypothetical protein PVAG01_06288 [Phlyctema vagabunda]|uniref:Uncharacterized protein n=1 Tax=Phlyctema vagabunda TaxID=108571 RepID=A0ABR4PFN1_9HELO